jgi:uncharacterized membrane protein
METASKNIKILFTAIGIIFVWRGIWGLADKFLFPENEILSFSVSMLIGLFILFIADSTKKDISELN